MAALENEEFAVSVMTHSIRGASRRAFELKGAPGGTAGAFCCKETVAALRGDADFRAARGHHKMI
jgi:hypothetical protein